MPCSREWQPPAKYERESGDGGQRPSYSGYSWVRPHGPFLAGPQRHLYPDSPAPGFGILDPNYKQILDCERTVNFGIGDAVGKL